MCGRLPIDASPVVPNGPTDPALTGGGNVQGHPIGAVADGRMLVAPTC